MSAKATVSVPQACSDWAETMAVHQVVLCIQDTTKLDFNGQVNGGGIAHCASDALGAHVPGLERALMFEPDEWKAAYILNKLKVPNEPPTLNEVVSRA